MVWVRMSRPCEFVISCLREHRCRQILKMRRNFGQHFLLRNFGQHFLLCEASDVVNECLEGQDGVQRWISAVARDGAGITMRKNLKIVREMILSIQQVARDYFRQNPLD